MTIITDPNPGNFTFQAFKAREDGSLELIGDRFTNKAEVMLRARTKPCQKLVFMTLAEWKARQKD